MEITHEYAFTLLLVELDIYKEGKQTLSLKAFNTLTTCTPTLIQTNSSVAKY